jgi:hypothetical protein
LVQLQADDPEIASKVAYAEPFSDWDASTGFHLPKNEQIVRIATHLVKITRPVAAMDTSQFHTKPKPTKSSKPKKTARKSLF